jgi:RNA polymerase sigma-70 factor (ECF subfamily)
MSFEPKAVAPSPTALYEAESDYVWNALRRLGVPEGDREDVAHEVFIAVFKALDTYDASRPLRPWLFGVALRVAARHRARNPNVREVPADAAAEPIDDRTDPDESMAQRQRQQLVHRALSSIELNRRGVFILHELDGQAVPEVAQALGLPLNTAYSRLRLARQEFTAAVRRLQGSER